MEGVALEVEVLKGCEVDPEEKREGSPGKGDLGRSCLGFGNLRSGYIQDRHTDRRDKKRKLSLSITQMDTFNSPRPTTAHNPRVQKHQVIKQFHS